MTILGDLSNATPSNAQCSATGPDVFYTFFGGPLITAQLTFPDAGGWEPRLLLKDECFPAAPKPQYLVCAQGSETLDFTDGGAARQYWLQVDSRQLDAGTLGPFQLTLEAN